MPSDPTSNFGEIIAHNKIRHLIHISKLVIVVCLGLLAKSCHTCSCPNKFGDTTASLLPNAIKSTNYYFPNWKALILYCRWCSSLQFSCYRSQSVTELLKRSFHLVFSSVPLLSSPILVSVHLDVPLKFEKSHKGRAAIRERSVSWLQETSQHERVRVWPSASQ